MASWFGGARTGESGEAGSTRRPVGWIPVLVACVVACSSVAHPFTVSAQDDGGDFAGEYTVTISSGDLPISLGLSSTLTGAWRIAFGDDGEYAAARQDVGTAVTGIYEVSGDEVTITDEAGLLSCSNLQPDGNTAPTATYAWEKSGDLLRLEPVADVCRLRRALLSTNPLSPFVPCLTTPLQLAADEGTDRNGETPSAGGAGAGPNDLGDLLEEDSPEGTPGASPEASPEAATPATAPTEPAGPTEPAEIGTADDPEDAITDVLAQLTACWATGDPTLVLPLFSDGFIDEATGNGAVSLDELADEFRQLQTTPITWELAGEVEVDDDEASAIIAVTLADEELLQTFLFELGDDGWRLGNFGE